MESHFESQDNFAQRTARKQVRVPPSYDLRSLQLVAPLPVLSSSGSTISSAKTDRSRSMEPEIDLEKPPLPIAEAYPVKDLDRAQLSALRKQGYPQGLAEELGRSRHAYPHRFWVVDNSGSMRASDGTELRQKSSGGFMEVQTTRWKELQGCVDYHIDLANLVEAPTVFRMLNSFGSSSPEFTVGDSDPMAVDRAKSILIQSEPKGVTPLKAHLDEIAFRVRALQGQQAVVVLATDGLPSNDQGETTPREKNEFIQALKAMQSLPVWIVIRLCTDNDNVIDFYNGLDAVLELPLEVIDDFWSEGREVREANPWLVYGLPLHRCREMGYHHRIFDLLDERLLTKDELVEFLTLMFGATSMSGYPDPHEDWKKFLDFVTKVVASESKVYDPHSKKVMHWIDLKRLDKSYGKFGLFGRRLR